MKMTPTHAIYFILICFIISYFVQIGTTYGISMMPTLNNHCIVLIAPNYYEWFEFKKGDIIILKGSGKYLCKRVIKIKKNHLWVEGDNKLFSKDSREFGWIEKGQVRSKVLCKLWGY